MSTLAEKLKTLRAKAGLSQEELAAQVGVSTSAVGNWEAGLRKSIRGPSLLSLASVLGVPPEELVESASRVAPLPPDEVRLIAAYRKLDAERRKIALDVVRALRGVA